MHQQEEPADLVSYPHGRGYGHDFMRGGEVLGGYGYSERPEYDLPRGEVLRRTAEGSTDGDPPIDDGAEALQS
jgi:hypothetical protein